MKSDEIVKDLFVPYDIAESLKLLGFNEPCIAFYSTEPYLHMLSQKPTESIKICTNDEFGTNTAAPIIQQAADWLMAKYGYFISPTYDTRLKEYGAMAGDEYDLYFVGYHETQSMAMNAMIKKTIELINEKNDTKS